MGAQRSGTTWLQRLLAAHPAVATTQETDLLQQYIRSWSELWDRQLGTAGADWRSHRHKGLPAVLTAEEFQEMQRAAIRTVYDKVASLKPAATVVLDKNPGYTLHVPLISSLLPEARFIHLVRDGRDVATSLMAAADTWGRKWAPRTVEAAARRWRRQVTAASSLALPPDRYKEVHYEDLHSDGPRILSESLRFCGVHATVEECSELVDSVSFARLKDSLGHDGARVDPILWSGEVAARLGGTPPEPEGFFGKGKTRTWQQEWSAAERWGFHRTAGDVLISLGYEPDGEWAGSPLLPRLAFGPTLLAQRGVRRLRSDALDLLDNLPGRNRS